MSPSVDMPDRAPEVIDLRGSSRARTSLPRGPALVSGSRTAGRFGTVVVPEITGGPTQEDPMPRALAAVTTSSTTVSTGKTVLSTMRW